MLTRWSPCQAIVKRLCTQEQRSSEKEAEFLFGCYTSVCRHIARRLHETERGPWEQKDPGGVSEWGALDTRSALLYTHGNNRPFSKIAAENSNKLKLKTYTSTRKSTFTLVTLQSFSISGVISAEKM